jgi:hypothetical protein
VVLDEVRDRRAAQRQSDVRTLGSSRQVELGDGRGHRPDELRTL